MPLQGTYLRERKTHLHPKTCYVNVYSSLKLETTQMSIIGEWVKKLCNNCTTEYYSATEKNILLIQDGGNSKIFMVNETSQIKKRTHVV